MLHRVDQIRALQKTHCSVSCFVQHHQGLRKCYVLVVLAHFERCVEGELRALQHAVLGCDHDQLDALVEDWCLDVGNCEYLECCPVKDLNLFRLLLEDEIGIPLPVLLQVSCLPLLNMFLPHIT